MITILGDGAWGTAIATVLAENNHDVLLWCFDQEVLESIKETRTNKCYLPDVKLPGNIHATSDLCEAMKSEIIFQAIPVKYLRSVLSRCKEHSEENQTWVSLSKGIENETFLFPTEIIRSVLGKNIKCVAVSGPSYAIEIAKKAPTIVTIAGKDSKVTKKIKELLQTDFLLTEISKDVIGTELGGAVKNVFALGIGILDGAGYGPNTQVRLMMQAIKEIKLLIQNFGGKESSFYNSSGIGDFVLTSFFETSRNRQVGQMIGEGKKLETILKDTGLPFEALAKKGYTAEGVNSVRSFCELSSQNKLNLPIIKTIYEIIFKNGTAKKLAEL